MIEQQGLPKCRLSCGEAHGSNFGTREACDSKCETKSARGGELSTPAG